MNVKEYIISDMMTDIWMEEFVMPRKHCSMCGNYGIVDTRGKIFTPAGTECGIKTFCMCPNGRVLKESGHNIEMIAQQPPQHTPAEGKLRHMLIAERAKYLLAMNAAYPEVGWPLLPVTAERLATEQIDAEIMKAAT